MKTAWLTLVFCGFLTGPARAQVQVSGRVSDGEGQALQGAAIYVSGSGKGTSSGASGEYSLQGLPADSLSIVFSYVGHKPQRVSFYASRDTVINISLLSQNLSGAQIRAERQLVTERVQTGVVNLQMAEIQKLPALFGETDIMRALTLTPGVSNGSEGSMGVYIRGGSPDQNLVLLDGVPLYNVAHILGFFSLFNTETISQVEVMKGGLPARYGGRLAAVTDLQVRSGDLQKHNAEFNIGLLTAKGFAEGPLKKGSTSYLAGARASYINLWAKPVMKLINGRKNLIDENIEPGFGFYDANLHIFHRFSDRTRIRFTGYWGFDRINSKVINPSEQDPEETRFIFDMSWQTLLGSVTLEHSLSPDWNMTARLGLADFDYRTQQSFIRVFYVDDSRSGSVNNYFSRIRDHHAQLTFSGRPHKNHFVRAGISYIYHRNLADGNTFSVTTDPPKAVPPPGTPVYEGHDLTAFAEDEWRIASFLKAGIGVHGVAYQVKRSFYWDVQPRISLAFTPSENWAVKAAYSHMFQPIGMLSTFGIGLPTDLWVPATPKIAPQRSKEAVLGISASYPVKDARLEFSLDGYYRHIDGVLEYVDGAAFVNNADWQDLAARGTGRAYGAEFMLRKTGKVWSGWIGYTLSWSYRRFGEINGGEWFPYRYDRRHGVSVVFSWDIKPGISLSASWMYGTGNWVTLPVTAYSGSASVTDIPLLMQGGAYAEDIQSRNNFRMQAYHRLDLGVTFRKTRKWGIRTWTIGVYNAYSRNNPFLYFIDNDKGNIVLKKLSLFPVIPAFSYGMKFGDIKRKSRKK